MVDTPVEVPGPVLCPDPPMQPPPPPRCPAVPCPSDSSPWSQAYNNIVFWFWFSFVCAILATVIDWVAFVMPAPRPPLCQSSPPWVPDRPEAPAPPRPAPPSGAAGRPRAGPT